MLIWINFRVIGDIQFYFASNKSENLEFFKLKSDAFNFLLGYIVQTWECDDRNQVIYDVIEKFSIFNLKDFQIIL